MRCDGFSHTVTVIENFLHRRRRPLAVLRQKRPFSCAVPIRYIHYRGGRRRDRCSATQNPAGGTDRPKHRLLRAEYRHRSNSGCLAGTIVTSRPLSRVGSDRSSKNIKRVQGRNMTSISAAPPAVPTTLISRWSQLIFVIICMV